MSRKPLSVQAQQDRLRRKRREAGEVLSAAVLSQENAEGLDGSGLDFRDCRFQSCRLRNCDFTGAAFYCWCCALLLPLSPTTP